MIGKLLFLAALALAQGRPQGEESYIRDESSASYEYCPEDQRHFLLPHEYDCSKFYYCEYGVKWTTPRDCAPGTQFSFQQQECVHPFLANCTLLSSTTKTESTSTIPNTSTTKSQEINYTVTTPASTTIATTSKVELKTKNGDEEVGNDEIDLDEEEESSGEERIMLPNGCPANFDIHYLLPHENDCTKFYYCVRGQKVERDCSPGTHFNPTIQVCDWPENAGCSGGNSVSGGTTVGDSGEGDDEGEGGGSGAGGGGGSSEEGSGGSESEGDGGILLPNGCPADFNIHHLLPHEANCTKFYYCVRGEKVERECSPGTHFNPTIQVCDWPANAGCVGENGNGGNGDGGGEGDNGGGGGGGEGGSEGGGSGGDGGESGGGSGSSGGEGEIMLPNGCPVDLNIHYLLPHETDCTKFYYCVHGEKIERQCSPGTHFNPTIQVCDWPANAGCTGNGSSGDGSEGSEGGGGNGEGDGGEGGENGGSDGESGDGSEGNDGDGGILLPNGCPADFNIHHLLPHENDCTKFYYCVHGEKVERECSPGTHFNPTIQVCDWPAYAGCAGDNGNGGNGDGGSGSGDGGDGGGGSEDGKEGGSEGESGGGSENNDDGGILLPNGCPADFNVHHLLPHETDCTKFYYCVRGEKVERECSPGTHFNPTIQVCDWPAYAGCAVDNGNGGNGDGGSGSGDGGDGGDGSEDDKEGGSEGESGGGSENNDDGGILLPNGCPADFNVHHLLPHETDCTKFYYCVRGEKVERECSPGTHFNPTIQVCDWPANAGCAGDNGNGEEGGGGSEGGEGGGGSEGGGSEGGEGDGGSEGGGGEGGKGDGGSEGGGNEGGGNEGGGGGGQGEGDGSEGSGGSGEGNASEGGEGGGGGGEGDGGSGGNGGDGEILLPNGCPADFNIHYLLPHETDCTKFYYCVHGEKVERECSPGTHFNPTIQICDWPANAGCAGEQGNGGNGTGGGGGEEGGSGGGGQENGSEGGEVGGGGGDGGSGGNGGDGEILLPNGCPADFNIHYLLPHETDCTRFYYCVHGEKVERECSPGTHFNPVIQVCDWPENAGCSINGGNSGNEGGGGGESGGSGGNNGGGTEEGSSGGAGNNPEPNPHPDKCETGCNVLPWPHETDCDKFWRCDGTKTVSGACSEGLYFNALTFTCDYIDNVLCDENPVP